MGEGFKDRSWDERFKRMGDEAEGVFEAVYPEGWVRFGLERPPIRMDYLPDKMRYTPDYLTSKGLVEVQGLGRDRRFKMKHSKLAALQDWHEDFRVDLFVWDRTAERFGFVRLPDLEAVLEERGKVDHFPEGPAYSHVGVDELPVTTWYQRLEKMAPREKHDG